MKTLPQTRPEFDPFWVEHRYGGRFQAFQNLMPWRVRDVLLVSSLYDLYLFEEDGRLYEMVRNEYQDLYLTHFPELTRVASGKEALELIRDGKNFDLIITTLHIEDMPALKFAREVSETRFDVPVVLLAFDNSELKNILTHRDAALFDRVFIWQGDYRLIVAIIKQLEDRKNVDHDTKSIGVQSIILIEDNILYYSSFLPIIYSAVLKQTQQLILESVSLSDKYLRMRARPKILLAPTFEEAWMYYERYEECVLGIISDIDFLRGGKADPRAGVEFARNVRRRRPDLPLLLQSSTAEFEQQAREIGTSFVLKRSPLLLNELSDFIMKHFGFGDFVFRMTDGTEVGRATDLKSLEEQLAQVPEESIVFHAERNHFSTWLKARTEFGLARELRPKKVTDYASAEALRQHLIFSLGEYRRRRQGGIVMEFTKETFLPTASLARIGGGSLGGKARGLGFVNTLISGHDISGKFESVQISVPPGVVLGTDVFERFMDENNLRSFALGEADDEEIVRRFLRTGSFPRRIMSDLSAFLDLTPYPLAVRSSSLLEDSQYHPFAGVYATYMIPNNQRTRRSRLRNLIETIKRVYASTYFRAAKEYIRMTSFRLEEEKMGVIIQKMVGSTHGNRFYPDFSGVARSYNFYPVSPQVATDGIVSVALGLGKTIAEGGKGLRFSHRFPKHILQLSSPADALANNQTEFYALNLADQVTEQATTDDLLVMSQPLSVAEADGTLASLGSTYSKENDTITDGLARPGTRIVSFAPLLQHGLFPLCEIVDTLLQVGAWGLGTPVEIEFAVNLSVPPSKPKEFGLLQIRPLALSTHAMEDPEIDDVPSERILCSSTQVLGNGVISDIRDIVVVDQENFSRGKTKEVAREVSTLNEKLMREERPYLLIGPGRWGTLDPWLGVPVKWEQISGARAIVEGGFKDVDVAPSQGSHFFQNITSFQVAYFTVNPRNEQSSLDWEWLSGIEPAESGTFTRHLRFREPALVKVNGHHQKGVILKPGGTDNSAEH